MQTIDVADAQLTSILVLNGATTPADSVRVVARLHDGRSFSLTLLTLAGLQRHLAGALSLVTPRLLLVREPSEAAILDAVRSAVAQGIERFAVLDAPLEQ